MSEQRSWRHAALTIATDPAATDLELVGPFLADSYWARGIERAIMERSVRAALV